MLEIVREVLDKLIDAELQEMRRCRKQVRHVWRKNHEIRPNETAQRYGEHQRAKHMLVLARAEIVGRCAQPPSVLDQIDDIQTRGVAVGHASVSFDDFEDVVRRKTQEVLRPGGATVTQEPNPDVVAMKDVTVTNDPRPGHEVHMSFATWQAFLAAKDAAEKRVKEFEALYSWGARKPMAPVDAPKADPAGGDECDSL